MKTFLHQFQISLEGGLRVDFIECYGDGCKKGELTSITIDDP